tara:strand:+ start:452 stop:2626 length:2175 start_codon:yes stop_codon:yes gene_type:complete
MNLEKTDLNPCLEIGEGGIGKIILDDPDSKVNVLTEQVMFRIANLVDEAHDLIGKGELRVLVFQSSKSSFIVGADIAVIKSIDNPEQGAELSRMGQGIFKSIEDLSIPTIAAIHGICLGGGTELSLACDYRVASDDPTTAIGLPEVLLGILPAWGGTTRLTDLVGIQKALDMMLTGRRIFASEAKHIGLVDKVLPANDFNKEVATFAEIQIDGPEKSHHTNKTSPLQRLIGNTNLGKRFILSMAKKRILSKTKGHYPAQLKILEVVRRCIGSSLSRALEIEANAAGELIVTSVSKNLIHVFYLRENARKKTVSPQDTFKTDQVNYLGVIGAGIMGGGIAQLAAHRGIRVRMKDISHEAISSGLHHARKLFDQLVRKNRIEPQEAEESMDLISSSLDYKGFGRLDVVVEAVVEKMDVKRIVLRETEDAVPRKCILTTNTSSLSVDEMSTALSRPENFAGMHFFNPVHRMPLVEVVRGNKTSNTTIATICALATSLGKVPVVTGDGPGFLVNRILLPYMNEAGFLLEDGASVTEIDRAAKDFGMPMGPLRLVDEVGIDISRHAGNHLYEAFGRRFTPSSSLTAIYESGRIGKKNGLGFYKYDGNKEIGVDPEIYKVLGSSVPNSRTTIDTREIINRLFLSMINEAARALDAGIVTRACDVDLAMIMGTGFPPFRGGLLRFADTLHSRNILDMLEDLENRNGPRFAPADLIYRLASEDLNFYQSFAS